MLAPFILNLIADALLAVVLYVGLSWLDETLQRHEIVMRRLASRIKALESDGECLRGEARGLGDAVDEIVGQLAELEADRGR